MTPFQSFSPRGEGGSPRSGETDEGETPLLKVELSCADCGAGARRYHRPMPRAKTPHQKAEAELMRYGLTLPETDAGPAWPPARALRVRRKMFCVFGARGEPLDALTLIVKLPISAEMVQHLPFVRESKGWYKQHDWIIAHFGPGDDIGAEIDTLKAWMLQSYRAMAPKKLAKLTL